MANFSSFESSERTRVKLNSIFFPANSAAVVYMRVLTQLLPKLVPRLVRGWGGLIGGGGGAWKVRGCREWSLFSSKGPFSPKSVKNCFVYVWHFFHNWFWAADNSSGFGMQPCSRVVLSYVGTEGFVCSLFLYSFLPVVTLQSCTST